MIWEENKLRKIVENSNTIAECLRKLGLCTRGANFNTFRKKADGWNISYKHFDFLASEKARRKHQYPQVVSDEEVFCENSKVSQNCVLKRYKRLQIEYKCSLCPVGAEYNSLPIVLQLDHRNGVRNDNRKENLRWLCPNCHSQTTTYGTKGKRFNVKGKVRVRKKETLGSQRLERRKVDYIEVINKYLELKSYLGTAKLFGISDNAVKKIIKKYSIVNNETVRYTL